MVSAQVGHPKIGPNLSEPVRMFLIQILQTLLKCFFTSINVSVLLLVV